MRRSLLAMLLCSIPACAAGARPEQSGPLHLPSPDWRDQVIYFVLTDRFDDGDPSNNDQRAGEFDPADPRKYSGGDLRGLQRRLDYIQGLGATAVWITPPVANQWWSPRAQYGGYHGYWASDFSKVDAHLGTLADYRSLSRALHGRGMRLVQDIVVNHVGDWFEYGSRWTPTDPAADLTVRIDTQRRTAPMQPPLQRNDPRRPGDRAAGLYHWTPSIRDFADRTQELTFQLAGLDDLDTESPQVRRLLRKAHGDWIRDAGVDAFRIDTAFYVPETFFDDFLHADDPQAPGIVAVAKATGRDDFLAFGEGFAIDKPFADAGARKLDGYMRTPRGLRSMLNFPLYGSLGDVFARGAPSAVLGHRIGAMMMLHADPWRMPSFIDNHDVDRFLAAGSEAGLKQAVLAMLTLPGIPVIYYGTEQGFTKQRAAMFAGGVDAGGGDHFDVQAPLYRWLQGAIALRKAHPALRRGTPQVVFANAAAPGAIAWTMREGDERLLVALNSADAPSLLDNLALPAGTRLEPLFAIDGEAPPLQALGDGHVHALLPARSGFVWRLHDGPSAAGLPAPTMAPLPEAMLEGDARLRGQAEPGQRLELVVDGDAASPIAVVADTQGRWQATIPTDDMTDPAIMHRVVAWDGERRVASAPVELRVQRQWTQVARMQDPQGDDSGPHGRYAYPDDAGWRARRQGDLLGATAWTSGGALRLQLQMRSISRSWNPANGFDHVALGIYVTLPDEAGGVTALPLRHAELPDGRRWQRASRVHGWSNALFTAEGASPMQEGTAVAATPGIAVDAQAGTITLTYPARAFGKRMSLAGARLHITTWDYDGGWRPLTQQAAGNSFGGGDGTRDPLVLDTLDLTLR